jgi:hypothetical protein
VRLIPDPPVLRQLLLEYFIGEFHSQYGGKVKDDISDGKVFTRDHGEKKKTHKKLHFVDSLDMNPDPEKMPGCKYKACEDHGHFKIQMQHLLKEQIKKQNPEHSFFYDRHSDGLAEYDKHIQSAYPDGPLKVGYPEQLDNERIEEDDESDDEVPELEQHDLTSPLTYILRGDYHNQYKKVNLWENKLIGFS